MNNVRTLFSNRRSFLFLLFCILIVYGISFYHRQASYAHWLERSDVYVVDNVTAMSGMDSYYWLKVAREFDEGGLGKGRIEPTKTYPDGSLLAYKDTPSLLAEFISLAKNFTSGDYYRAGLLLIPLLAGLFVIPLFFYFNRFGFGAAAVMGGLVGTFSDAFYARTKMGRVDTELLNLFFPLAAACFILPINRDRSWRSNLLLAGAAGLTINLYVRWYQQPSLIGVYLGVIAVYLLFARVPWKQLVPVLLVYLLASGPENVLQTMQSLTTFLEAYVSPPTTGTIAWPNLFETIGETQNRGVLVTLEKLHGFLPLVAVGFAGLGYLCLRHFRKMIPVAPLLAFGAWSLVGPNRFAMYLAPFIGVGVGVLIELLIGYFGERASLNRKLAPVVSVSLMFAVFFAATAYTGFPRPPEPIMNAPTTRALLEIKKRVPQHSAMFTPYWEYGYPLMEIGDFATYHDGGTQLGIRGTLTAIAMTSDDQEDMVSLLAYLEDHGFKGLAATIRDKKLDAEQMLDLVFEYPGPFSGDNVYVLYLEKMIWKVYSMTKIGSWDFAERITRPTDYVELHCFAMVDNVMQCSDGTIDLSRGFMNDGTTDIPLRGALFVNDGKVIDERYYPHENGYYLQVLMRDSKAFLTLVADGRLFRTNFNQQFLLGNYDRRYFEEVYNDYPVARVFKLKNVSGKDTVETR